MKPLGCFLAANGLELEPCGVTQEPSWRQKSTSRWPLGAPWEHIKPIVHDLVDFRSNLCRFWSMFGDILSICLHKLCLQKRLSKTRSQTTTVMKTIPLSSNILMERRCVRDEKTWELYGKYQCFLKVDFSNKTYNSNISCHARELFEACHGLK